MFKSLTWHCKHSTGVGKSHYVGEVKKDGTAKYWGLRSQTSSQ